MKYFILLCVSCLIAINGTHAQVFMRPVDNAASMGVGTATISTPVTDLGIANDAQLGLGKKWGVMLGSAVPFGLSGWRTGFFQAYKGFGKSNGLGVEITSSATDDLGEQRYRLMYGRRLGSKILVGASANVLRISAREYGSATSATASVSALAQALPQLWIGASVQNPIQLKIGDDMLPTVLRIGATWKPGETLMIMAETEKDLDRPTMIKVGIQYKPSDMFALRLGVRNNEVARIALGIGIKVKKKWHLDLGSEWHPVLGITPALSILMN